VAKFIHSVASVVGAVASVVSLIPGPWAPIAKGVAAGASIVSAISGLMMKQPSPSGGSQTAFKAEPQAGVPYPMGRTMVGGNIVYWKGHGKKNKYQTLVTVLAAAGPVEAIEQTYLDKKPVSFQGGLTGEIVGDLHDRVWQDVQLGATPEAGVLSTGTGEPPGWEADCKLSGMAASMLTMEWDGKGDTTLTSTPAMGWLGKWVRVYDPRLDSTYPGGSGPCRPLQESTYVWSADPYLHALTWALGRVANGKKTLGCHIPIEGIDVARFVEGANVCAANGWVLGGQISSADGKYEMLKGMLQAGGGQPIHDAAILSCLINTPRVSLATIEKEDLAGKLVAPAMQTRRDRINAVMPRYRSEDHGWEVVSAFPVVFDAGVAIDGGQRTRELEYPLVQCFAGDDPDQAAQLAGYDIRDSREATGIALLLKLRFVGYRVGDCLTLGNLGTQFDGSNVIVTNRSLDPTTGIVTLTFRTEDATKHAWALALRGKAADPVPSDGPPDVTDPPEEANWTLTAESITSGALTLPAIRITGNSDDDSTVRMIRIEFRKVEPGAGDDDNWLAAGLFEPGSVDRLITDGIVADTDYEASIRYTSIQGLLNFGISDRLILGPVTTPGATVTPTPPMLGPATDLSVEPGSGEADVTWRNPTGSTFGYCKVYRSSTPVFGDAIELAQSGQVGLGQIATYNDTVAAGTYYWWVRAFATDGTPADPTGPVSGTVI